MPKPFNRFFVFVFFIHSSIFAQQNTLNLKISKLEAKWTSGGGNGTIAKGKFIVTFFAPTGIQTTVQVKNTTVGQWNNTGTYSGSAGGGTEILIAEVTDLDIRTELYCFRITALDGQGNLSVSKELCSLPFFVEPNTSADGKPILQIASHQPAYDGSYRPFITSTCVSELGCQNDVDDFVTKSYNLPNFYARKQLTNKIRCGETKILQVVIEIDNMTVISDTIHVIGNTKETPSTILDNWSYASVVNDKVQLIWYNDDVKNDNYTIEKNFVIERKEGVNGSYLTLNTPELQRKPGEKRTEWLWTDATSKPTEFQYYYRLSYFDYCANQSLPIDIVPIHLEQNRSYELVWNSQNNNDIFEYEIEYYDIQTALPRSLVTTDNHTNLLDPPSTANYYRIRTKLIAGDESIIYSNFIENAEKLRVINPTVFTPDGTGTDLNDTYKVFVRGYYTFSMNIYDRYGVLMYTSDNYDIHRQEGWDGTVLTSGIDAPEGVYAFEVRVTNKNRNSLTKNGSFVLIRKK